MKYAESVRCLVLLHGRRNNESDGTWLDALTGALSHAGQRLDASPMLLDYLDLLDRDDSPRRSRLPRPSIVAEQPSPAYLARAQRLRSALDLPDRAPRRRVPVPRGGPAVEQAIRVRMSDVHRYRGDPHRKDAILQHLLRALPTEARIVLVAHSLGSVVVLDLLRLLPTGVHVELLITTGSPLALPALGNQLLGSTKGFPEDVADRWLNVYDPSDVVTAGTPLGPTRAHAVDAPVDNGDDRHRLARYLAQPVVSAALHHIGWTTPRPDARARRTSHKEDDAMPKAAADDEALPPDLLGRLVALQYGSHVEANLPIGDQRARHYQARLKVRDNVDRALKEAGWDLDPSDDLAPLLRGRYKRGEAVGVLVELATSNPLAPFEVSVPREVRRDALTALAKDLRLPGDTWGPAVLDAVELAKRAHERRRWGPILLGAAGLGLLVAGPLAVGVLGAAYGGAAAITAGLAALGPGGMAGGLWLVGLSAGTGGVALRSALSALTPEQLQIEVLRIQATGLAKKRRDVPKRGAEELKALGVLLQAAGAEVDEHKKIDDPKSATYREVEAKRDLLKRAVDWSDKHLRSDA